MDDMNYLDISEKLDDSYQTRKGDRDGIARDRKHNLGLTGDTRISGDWNHKGKIRD